jgi:hypothetical protein
VRVAVGAIDPERAVHVAVPRRAAVQQRRPGQRGGAARRRSPFESVRGERAAGNHRQPTLHPTDVDARSPFLRAAPLMTFEPSCVDPLMICCNRHIRLLS